MHSEVVQIPFSVIVMASLCSSSSSLRIQVGSGLSTRNWLQVTPSSNLSYLYASSLLVRTRVLPSGEMSPPVIQNSGRVATCSETHFCSFCFSKIYNVQTKSERIIVNRLRIRISVDLGDTVLSVFREHEQVSSYFINSYKDFKGYLTFY